MFFQGLCIDHNIENLMMGFRAVERPRFGD
jgi:hypothetical protein